MADLTTERVTALVDVLADHRYREVMGDYEIAPYYMHFGCSCGWEQNIAGMSGWHSWVAAHQAHVAAALAPVVAGMLAAAVERAYTAGWLDHLNRDGTSPQAGAARQIAKEETRAELS